MKHLQLALLFLALAFPAKALPGFGVQLVGPTSGFGTSIAIDSHGTIYYTAQNGNIYRVDSSGTSTLVAQVVTTQISDAGLLGMALLDDNTAVVHYTTGAVT